MNPLPTQARRVIPRGGRSRLRVAAGLAAPARAAPLREAHLPGSHRLCPHPERQSCHLYGACKQRLHVYLKAKSQDCSEQLLINAHLQTPPPPALDLQTQDPGISDVAGGGARSATSALSSASAHGVRVTLPSSRERPSQKAVTLLKPWLLTREHHVLALLPALRPS